MDSPLRPVNDPLQPFDAPPQRRQLESSASIDPVVLRRITSEFREMRGFSPTLPQAARLFDLSPAECSRLLESLVDAGVLQITSDGCYRLMHGE